MTIFLYSETSKSKYCRTGEKLNSDNDDKVECWLAQPNAVHGLLLHTPSQIKDWVIISYWSTLI